MRFEVCVIIFDAGFVCLRLNNKGFNFDLFICLSSGSVALEGHLVRMDYFTLPLCLFWSFKVLDPIDSHNMDKKHSNIIQSIFFYSAEGVRGLVNDYRIFIFARTYFFSNSGIFVFSVWQEIGLWLSEWDWIVLQVFERIRWADLRTDMEPSCLSFASFVEGHSLLCVYMWGWGWGAVC